ncbi:sigma-54-dependent transcriptional regulator [Novosphingobium sp. M1R2S20]|uniref:Sigma-54-dependent transcriptional regulator n=1 Tax=Novosphingobium rhizovicinum TaxID=3228928 RepID=A0ABV3R8U4_9SPHN
MFARSSNLIRLTLVGTPQGEFRLAAEMAREAGAQVVMTDSLQAALEALRRHAGDLVMVDVTLDAPDFLRRLRAERIGVPVLACGIHAPAERAVAAIRAGALDYIPLPPDRELIAAAILNLGHRVSSPVGEDPVLKHAMSYAQAVAPSDAPVLIAGEAGTGKEVMARMIHEVSGRCERFVVVECAGVAAEVIESELFGHDAGAFVTAVAPRVGRLEEAGEGTVFLREIGALPAVTQARLVGILQDGIIRGRPGGGTAPLRARIIASSSRDLSAQVAAGTFRADLLARLGLLRIELPPLRARGDDIAMLAVHFAECLAGANGLEPRPLSAEALERLKCHDWPGNVRELEDVIHRAILLARGPVIESDALVLSDGLQIRPAEGAGETGSAELEIGSLVGRSVADVERELILQTLKRCGGNRTTASTILGISVRTMRNKLKSFIEAGITIAPAA